MYASTPIGVPPPSYLLDPAYGSLKQDMVGAHNAYNALFPLEMEPLGPQERGMALPPFVGTTSETCFTPAELAHYSTDEFRMFAFKVFRCTKRFAHDWRTCPFAHPTENARRRDPNVYRYSAVACPDYKQGFCMRGELCPYAHGVFECWLHPSRYRTQLCKDGTACSRPLCFFAHSLHELRAPTHTWTPSEEDPQLPQAHAYPEQSGIENNHPAVAQSPGSPSQSLVQVAAQLAAVSMGGENGEDNKAGPSDLVGLTPGSQTAHSGHIRTHRHKQHHHHHHHHHHHSVQRGGGSSNTGAACSLGLTSPRMSNAFARRHGLNPKDNAMLNLQKIAIQQAQLANNGGAAPFAPQGTEPHAAGSGNHAQLMKSSAGTCTGRQHHHHHHHQQRMERLVSNGSSSGFDGTPQHQQHAHHGGAGRKGSSTLNHVAAAAANAAVSVPSATPASTSTATAVAAVAAVAGGASDGSVATSSNHSGTSSNHSSSHNSSMHLSNLSADSSGPISGSASGNSSSPLGLLPTPPPSTAAAASSAYLPQRDATSPYMHAANSGSNVSNVGGGKGSRSATAHFMAAGAAPTPPLHMHIQAAMNGGAGNGSVAPSDAAAGCNSAGNAARAARSNSTGTSGRGGGSHRGMMLPLAWPVTGAGNTVSSAHADAACNLAALQQHLEAFSFQPAHPVLAEQQRQALGPMGMANFAGGTNRSRTAMGMLAPQQQQQSQQQQLLEDYMHSVQGLQN